MEKNKTPLAKLIDLEKQLITDSINYKSSSWNKGYLAAMRTFINKAKELLPEERKMVSDLANDYADAVMGGCNFRGEEWFDQNYEQ